MHHPQKKALPNENQISSHHILATCRPLHFNNLDMPMKCLASETCGISASLSVDTVPCRAMPGTPLVFANRGRKMAHCGKPREQGFMILTGSKDRWMTSTLRDILWLCVVVIIMLFSWIFWKKMYDMCGCYDYMLYTVLVVFLARRWEWWEWSHDVWVVSSERTRHFKYFNVFQCLSNLSIRSLAPLQAGGCREATDLKNGKLRWNFLKG